MKRLTVKKLTVNPAICVEVIPQDHTLIVSTDEAVILRCTSCDHIKDMMCFMENLPISYAPSGQRWCRCHDDHDAPDNGGDVQRILVEINEALNSCSDFQGVRDLLVALAFREDTKRRSGQS